MLRRKHVNSKKRCIYIRTLSDKRYFASISFLVVKWNKCQICKTQGSPKTPFWETPGRIFFAPLAREKGVCRSFFLVAIDPHSKLLTARCPRRSTSNPQLEACCFVECRVDHWWLSVLTLELSRIKCPRRSTLNRHLKLVVTGKSLILVYKV
jgi:hypothetical protein